MFKWEKIEWKRKEYSKGDLRHFIFYFPNIINYSYYINKKINLMKISK